jgi:hypothetical protein
VWLVALSCQPWVILLIHPLIKQEMLVPADGPGLVILGKAKLWISFSEDIKLLIEFSVLKACAVPILLGLDVCQILKSTLDYEHEVWSFKVKMKSLALQLYSKKTLSAHIGDQSWDGDLFDSLPQDETDDNKVLLLQTLRASTGDFLDDGLLLRLEVQKPLLPPLDPFSISRSVPNFDEFEEDLSYFDLPGKVSDDFEDKVSKIVNDSHHVSSDTRTRLRDMLLGVPSFISDYPYWYARDKGFQV